MIKLENLSAGYGSRTVLSGMSMSIEPGKVTALLGPNGCGKSTLLRTICGLQRPLAGQVVVDGTPSDELTSRQMALNVSYLAQSRNTPNILARRMVLHGRFPHVPYPRRYGREDYAAVDRAMRMADAADLAASFMGELSGGERQKVYLAMTLAQDTQTILMDEPTTYLDIAHQLKVLEISRQLAREGKALLLVLHDVCQALRWVDQTAVISEGRIKFLGTPVDAFETGILDEVFGVRMRRFEAQDGWQYYCQ